MITTTGDQVTTQTAAAPVGAPEPQPADGGRTYTEDEVRRRLVGQGKEIERRDAEIAALKAERGEMEAIKAERDRLLALGQQREAAVKADLTARGQRLPEHLRTLIPPGMVDQPELAAFLISQLEARALAGAAAVATLGDGAAAAPMARTAEQLAEDERQKNLAAFFPKKKGG